MLCRITHATCTLLPRENVGNRGIKAKEIIFPMPRFGSSNYFTTSPRGSVLILFGQEILCYPIYAKCYATMSMQEILCYR